MESLRELYKVGNGPSSSHTMGPARAARVFQSRYPLATSFEVVLYGSLAATGEGHLTDYIIKKTLEPSVVEIVWRAEDFKPFHPNAMKFIGYNEAKEVVGEWTVYSVGGGSIIEEGQGRGDVAAIYPHSTMAAILQVCEEKGWTLADYVYEYEPDIKPYLEDIRSVMKEALVNGLSVDGPLPGKLNYPRRAKQFYEHAKKDEKDLSILIYAYALAVSEQNASGDIVVTAPTCGASGVIPGVLFAIQEFEGYSDEQIIDALAVAGLIGNLIKTNASISGAEVGCQGEVGSACSMAAAAVSYLRGGSNLHCEYAAEIGLEHHLGMTCDPVFGYVQVPCIERNAVAAKRAYDAAKYAMLTDGYHTITLDQCMETMKETGHDLMAKYRETAQGGLAKHFAEC
ncbi:MAG TPA: serine dehydratase [Firmicutes bacterium]|nr:serine dehydratase [Bacillota bacterium]